MMEYAGHQEYIEDIVSGNESQTPDDVDVNDFIKITFTEEEHAHAVHCVEVAFIPNKVISPYRLSNRWQTKDEDQIDDHKGGH